MPEFAAIHFAVRKELDKVMRQESRPPTSASTSTAAKAAAAETSRTAVSDSTTTAAAASSTVKVRTKLTMGQNRILKKLFFLENLNLKDLEEVIDESICTP